MEKWKRISGRITSALIILMAILLIVSCVSIYQSGSRPFNREVIAEYAANISVFGILCLIFVIAGLLLPGCSQKTKAVRDLRAQLSRYSSLPEAAKEQQLRKNYRLASLIGTAALAIYPVIYLSDPAHFRVSDVNGDVLRAALVVLIPTALAMALNLILQGRAAASIAREIDLYREMDIKPGQAPEKRNTDPKKIRIVRAALLITGVVMVVIGAINGGAADVLGKAIRICTECIGLG